MPRHLGRDDEVLDAVRVAVAALESDDAAALAGVAAVVERALFDQCEIEVADDQGGVRSIGPRGVTRASALDIDAATMDLGGMRRRVQSGGPSEVWSSPGDAAGTCVVVGITDADGTMGTIAGTMRPGRELTDHVLGLVEEIGRVTGDALGRVLLTRRTRDAVRRSQRIASQLHQLIATSITVAGLRSEREVVESVAVRVRNVFGGDESVVSLDVGLVAPLRVAASGRRARVLADGDATAPHPPLLAGKDVAPVREGEWLAAPILARRGETRGTVAVRRTGGSFSDDDVEVITLLAQMAASAIDAAELNRSIQRSEERLRVLVEAAPVGIVETDHEDRIEWWNRAARSLFAWPEVDDDRRGATAEFPSSIIGPLRELWEAAREGAGVTGHDLAGIEIDGRRRDVAASVALLPATPGRAGNLLTLVEDVTDHRQLMEELRHAQRMDVIGQLSSSVAHDFNNLLTLISGYAELQILESSDADRTRQLARDIQTTTTRASTLTGKLLTMGRTKSPTPVVFSPVAVVSSIAEVLDRILGTDVTLELSLARDAGAVRTDQDQFEQMVMNLATNARDAMADGGVLRIEIEPTSLGADEAARAGIDQGDFVRITVADTGEGMDEETQRRCFEPLFTTKGPSKGTGLGLPAARRVVVEAGGSIEVRSEPGRGTTFDILLPSAGEAPTEVVPESGVAAEVQPATVLLAEDEDGIRQLVSRVLRHNGYDVLEAASAERGH